jgi:hypothetical protein
MLFSNTDIPEFNFTFNERTIPITKKSSTISLAIHPALPNRDESQFLSVIHHGWNS